MSDQLKIVSCRCDGQTGGVVGLKLQPAGIARVPGELDFGLRGYYPLGEHHGTDISGLGNHATPALDEPADLRTGILCENAEYFDGRQSFVLPFELPGSISVSLWIKPEYVRREATILSVGPNIRFGLSFLLEPIITINYGQDDETHVTTSTPLVADKWVHLAMTYDCNGAARIFKNGAKVDLLREGVPSVWPSVPVVPEANRRTPRISWYSRDVNDEDQTQSSGLHGCAQDIVIRAGVMTVEEIAIEYASYCSELFEIT